jgi:hypothetical protein
MSEENRRRVGEGSTEPSWPRTGSRTSPTASGVRRTGSRTSWLRERLREGERYGAIAELRNLSPEAFNPALDEAAMDGLKFSECLPVEVATRVLNPDSGIRRPCDGCARSLCRATTRDCSRFLDRTGLTRDMTVMSSLYELAGVGQADGSR